MSPYNNHNAGEGPIATGYTRHACIVDPIPTNHTSCIQKTILYLCVATHMRVIDATAYNKHKDRLTGLTARESRSDMVTEAACYRSGDDLSHFDIGGTQSAPH